MKTLHWTSRDLELLPEDGSRYEIVDGELYVAKQPGCYARSYKPGCLVSVFFTRLIPNLTAKGRV